MVIEYYEDTDRGNLAYNSEFSEEEYEEEDEDYYEFEEECDYDVLSATIFDKCSIDISDNSSPVVWKLINIGNTNLRVSNEGKIHFIDENQYYITEGFRDIGTPYRFVDIRISDTLYRKYYVHDIIWKAFKPEEDIPDGWEVRHLDYTALDDGQCYINNIDNLSIYEKIVNRDFSIV
jgi:hypothetical protein